ncbi:MAG TPA: hypothetical protein PLU43_10425 [Lachnospiraceae bacterium]|nr:hypothetical protein [Lachnospiraceae bacterium]
MQAVTMTVSSVITKGKKRFVRVSFTRGTDFAEGTVPDNHIERAKGFTEEEIIKLEEYLASSQTDIMERAGKINPLKSWMKETIPDT